MGFILFLYAAKVILENASLENASHLVGPTNMQIKGFKSSGSRTPVKLPELSGHAYL